MEGKAVVVRGGGGMVCCFPLIQVQQSVRAIYGYDAALTSCGCSGSGSVIRTKQ